MNRFAALTTSLLFAMTIYGQQLSQVIFSGGSTLAAFSFITDQKAIIRISAEGNILEWGTDPGSGRYGYYSGRLQPFMGRVDYYGKTEYDSLIRGKVKSIGTCTFSYYSASEDKSKAGKLKSIGSLSLDYFSNFDNQLLRGKLKSAGYLSFDYYSSMDNEAFRGNLKTIGNTSITYYSSFDDRLIRGKVKSIDSFNYTWYSSHDGSQFQGGGLKSGLPTENINGVTYIVR
jgi:hypothetical protein